MTQTRDQRVYTDELLTGAVTPRAGQRVLALGVDAAPVLDWARAVGPVGRVVALERWLPEYRALASAAEHARLAALRPVFAATLAGLDEQTFDLAALDIGTFQSAKALLALATETAARLVPGGLLFVAGPKDEGIVSFGKRIAALFGNAEPLAYRKGQRVIVARRDGPLIPPDLAESYAPYDVTVRGLAFTLTRDPAVFARGEVDDATAMLVGALDVRPDDRVLDIGGGAGIIGLVAARLATAGRVVLTEADAGALDLAARNLARNGVTNARVVAADVTDTLADERFTLAVANPPFHQRGEPSSALAERFMRAGHAALESGGRFAVVANRFLAYEPRVQAIFGNVTELAGDTRYKVLAATKA